MYLAAVICGKNGEVGNVPERSSSEIEVEPGDDDFVSSLDEDFDEGVEVVKKLSLVDGDAIQQFAVIALYRFDHFQNLPNVGSWNFRCRKGFAVAGLDRSLTFVGLIRSTFRFPYSRISRTRSRSFFDFWLLMQPR